MTTTIVALTLAITSTFVSAFMAILSYWHFRRQSVESFERTKRYPDIERHAKLLVEIEHCNDDLSRLRDERNTAEQVIEQAQRERDWIASTRDEITRLEQDRLEVVRIQNEIATTGGELAELKQKLIEGAATVDDQASKLQKLRDDYAVMDRKLSQFTDSVQRLEKRQADLNDSIRTSEQTKSELDKEIEVAEREVRKIRRDCEDLGQKKDKLSTELVDLEKKCLELRQSRSKWESDLSELRKTIAELEGRKAALGVEVDATTKIAERITSSSGVSKLSESDLWLPAIIPHQTTRNGKLAELDCLSQLESSLESLGLNFDQRTIYAFHTALKSTNSSPLVTLAGVSGTGKSELPKRYAEALGINFLNVPVQPRWDSPQDLFGFYDYLERRYRPTELTRALLQMDPIGPNEDRGWHPSEKYKQLRVDDEMLLVLFDEMNLARVEYYFSEFLSKLETRRNVDLNDVEKRQKAEIVLEVAGRQAGALPLRLFVDNNVLFVGTMNEDESTQALSDKVIDRSNILRFGSPTKFEPQRVEDPKKPDGPPRLLRENWKDWCKSWADLDRADEAKLVNWIEAIRKPLEEVGRPFAYRVSYAILEYAANYPVVPERLNKSMADQVEQRVLPKLIGLDTQHPNFGSALDAIRQVLVEVGDQKLIEKIDSSRRKDDYFQWTGLDRTI